ncbi:MAG TPA: methyl-accepting chemotaxis protein, partial [Chloroflexia bacterium]|nr:methyl-accepting chemotaxis protein [Chloroflexia bacterium]
PIAAQQAAQSLVQASAITQMSGTMEELSQTSDQIADAALTVAEAAEQTLASVQRSQAAVQAGMAGMVRIKDRINDIAARNLTLADQSRRVHVILDLLEEISAQTHILALNASIESAGAGAAGARFGVIAAEVKTLAQNSAAATREVQDVVAEYQTSITAAMEATAEGLREGDAGLRLAEQSGAANAAIAAEAARTAKLVQAIHLATQQQRTASGQVVTTIREVVGLAQQTAAGSQETLAAVQQLDAVAQHLGADRDSVPPAPLAVPPPRSARTPDLVRHIEAGV